ncbi:hypothetical protein [Mycoplasma todarodis]|uniref:DUF4430 domain-containing protein n=1 Tax=Mycoplasma todarodis TaxID=1937191 RepID=A0A4R0XLP0_9MOLU|nr:hypothetical protein [Mycoplasma todarodis]TCG11593.1 hypothetical protein C4B25_01270 [Mycoplasma todarodis]
MKNKITINLALIAAVMVIPTTIAVSCSKENKHDNSSDSKNNNSVKKVKPKTTTEPKTIAEPKTVIKPKTISKPKVTTKPKIVTKPKQTLKPKITPKPKQVIKPTKSIYNLDGNRTDKTDIKGVPFKGKGEGILQQTDYNLIHETMVKKPGKQIALVVIANHHFYTEIIDIANDHKKLTDLMDASKRFKFRYFEHEQFGRFMNTFKFKKTKNQAESTHWLHGTNRQWNYQDYFMMLYFNHKFASMGVSSTYLNDNDIMEFTYDHNSKGADGLDH